MVPAVDADHGPNRAFLPGNSSRFSRHGSTHHVQAVYFEQAGYVVTGPEVLFADEPTGNLDSKNGIEVMNLLTELNREGATIVMVTHSDRDAGFAHRTINLFDGMLLTKASNNTDSPITKATYPEYSN